MKEWTSVWIKHLKDLLILCSEQLKKVCPVLFDPPGKQITFPGKGIAPFSCGTTHFTLISVEYRDQSFDHCF